MRVLSGAAAVSGASPRASGRIKVAARALRAADRTDAPAVGAAALRKLRRSVDMRIPVLALAVICRRSRPTSRVGPEGGPSMGSATGQRATPARGRTHLDYRGVESYDTSKIEALRPELAHGRTNRAA